MSRTHFEQKDDFFYRKTDDAVVFQVFFLGGRRPVPRNIRPNFMQLDFLCLGGLGPVQPRYVWPFDVRLAAAKWVQVVNLWCGFKFKEGKHLHFSVPLGSGLEAIAWQWRVVFV